MSQRKLADRALWSTEFGDSLDGTRKDTGDQLDGCGSGPDEK